MNVVQSVIYLVGIGLSGFSLFKADAVRSKSAPLPMAASPGYVFFRTADITLRDSGKIVHLYGTLLRNVPDYNSSQLQVDRIEILE